MSEKNELVDLIINKGTEGLGGKNGCIATFAIMPDFPGVQEDLKRGCIWFMRTFQFCGVEYLFIPNITLSSMLSHGAGRSADEIIFASVYPFFTVERYVLHPRKTLRKLQGRQYLRYGTANTEVFEQSLKDGQLVFKFDYRTLRMPLSVYADSVETIDEKVSKRKAENTLYNVMFDDMLHECVTSGFGGRHQMLVRAKLFGKAYDIMFNQNSK